MGQPYVETQTVPPAKISQHIATHLHVRYPFGRVLIVSDKPERMLIVVRKHWARAARLLRIERSATLDKNLTGEIDAELGRMDQLEFGAVSRLKNRRVDVNFARPNELTLPPEGYATIYWCAQTGPGEPFVRQLPQDCVVILYAATAAPAGF